MNITNIDTFQQQMKCICLELCHPIESNRILELCREIDETMKEDVVRRLHTEYDYHFGDRPTTGWMDQPSVYDFGYVEYLKHVLTKLLCTQLGTRQNKTVMTYILRFHSEWFGRERYWNDEEMDALDEVMRTFRNRYGCHA